MSEEQVGEPHARTHRTLEEVLAHHSLELKRIDHETRKLRERADSNACCLRLELIKSATAVVNQLSGCQWSIDKVGPLADLLKVACEFLAGAYRSQMPQKVDCPDLGVDPEVVNVLRSMRHEQ